MAALSTPLGAQLPKAAVRRLDSLLDSPPFNRNLWGVALVDERGRLLYGRNPDKLFIPASNTKLVVSAVASALFSPDWTVPTSVYADGPVSDGAVQGDLVLYGRGDPTFGQRCYATDTTRVGACDRDPFARLRDLADGLARDWRTHRARRPGRRRQLVRRRADPPGLGQLRPELVVRSAGLGAGLQRQQRGLHLETGRLPSTPPPRSPWIPTWAMSRSRIAPGTVPPGGDTDIGDRMYREPGTLRLWAEGTVTVDHAGGKESFALPDPNLFAARAFRRELAEAGISVEGTTQRHHRLAALSHGAGKARHSPRPGVVRCTTGSFRS